MASTSCHLLQHVQEQLPLQRVKEQIALQVELAPLQAKLNAPPAMDLPALMVVYIQVLAK